jgi:hypothetical protein
MNDKSEPEVGLDKLGEPIIDPAPDRPPGKENSPTSNAMVKGAKWGAVAGLIIAQMYIGQHSPHGFYMGNLLAVFAVCIGLCTFIGAAIGWLSIYGSPPDQAQ